MSRYDYLTSKVIAAEGYPFAALVMAAMRQADTDNETLLHSAFPEIWKELERRYEAPGGLLPHEVQA